MFALWCSPVCLSRPLMLSWAALSCRQCSSVPQRAAPQLHNRQQLIMESKIPQPQLPVPKYCPLLSTHTLSHSPRLQTAREAGEGTQIYGVSHTWKHMNTLTHLTYMRRNTHHLIRQDASQPLAALTKVPEVTQLLSSPMLMTGGCEDMDN